MTERLPPLVALGAALAASLAASLGCGPLAARDVGEQLFNDPRFSLSEANPFSCATCHSVDDTDTRMLAGGSLVGATARPIFWGGFETSILDATNVCITRFMRGGALGRDEPRGRALYEYLRSLSPAPSADAVPFSVVENVAAVARGDAAAGEGVYTRACAGCHGAAHTGEGRLDASAVLVPEASAAFAASLGYTTDLVVIEKVRHGVFFHIGGTMPPYSLEVLSDEDLGALLSYLGL